LAKRVPIYGAGSVFNLFVRALPLGDGARQQGASFFREDEDTAAAVVRVKLDFHESAAFQWLQGCCEGGSIHGQQGSDRPHRRRLRTVQRHQERKLAVGQIEGAQLFIEAPGQGPSGTLDVETETTIPNEEGCFVRQRFCT
jgi:hypothetical protein